MPKRQLTGKVVSIGMQKTIVVEVESMKIHPKYLRHYKFHKRYKAHNEKGEYQIGDQIIIEECRPISKEKRWKVIEKNVQQISNVPQTINPETPLST